MLAREAGELLVAGGNGFEFFARDHVVDVGKALR
jgi:hypothetical protein